MTTFDYKTVRINSRNLYRKDESRQLGKYDYVYEWGDLSELGSEGWELVQIWGNEGEEANATLKRITSLQ